MAKSSSQITLMLFLTILVALTTTSSGLIINGILASQVRILGLLRCDSPSPPPVPNSRPIFNNTNVALVCNGRGIDVVEAVADVNGFYQFVINSTDSILFHPNNCYLAIRLPIALCGIYPPNGILRATVTFVGFLQPLFNAIAILTAGPLRLVT